MSVQFDITTAEVDADGPYFHQHATDFGVDVNNGNAVLVLERIGRTHPHDFHGGHIDPDELLGLVMVANVGRDDSGCAGVTDTLPGGAKWTDFGIRPGYFEDVMGRLANLAVEAKRRGAVVGWG